MKNNKYLIFFLVTISFFTFCPKLVLIPYSSFIPKIIFSMSLCFIFFKNKTQTIRVDFIVLILIFYIFSLSISYFINENDLVLNILIYAIFFVFILGAGISISPYLKSNSVIIIDGYNFYILLCLFLALPLSVILQFIFPDIAHYYYHLILYDEVLNESFEAIDGKYSGLTGGIGTGGSTALASILILFETIKFYFFDNSKLSNRLFSALVRIVYLVSIVMNGTAGLLLPTIYYMMNYFLYVDKIMRAFWKLILFFSIGYVSLIYILPIFEIQGISYFKVLIDEGFDELLNHRSIGALIGQYNNFWQNFDWVLNSAGFFGNPDAIGYYDITDIGFLNEINLTGLSGFILLNVYLISALFFGFKKSDARLFCKTEDALRCALVSTTLYSIVLQFKEFSSLQGNGNQALTIVLLIVLYGLRRGIFEIAENCKNKIKNI